MLTPNENQAQQNTQYRIQTYFWYRFNVMGTHKNAPKQIAVTLFPYIYFM